MKFHYALALMTLITTPALATKTTSSTPTKTTTGSSMTVSTGTSSTAAPINASEPAHKRSGSTKVKDGLTPEARHEAMKLPDQKMGAWKTREAQREAANKNKIKMAPPADTDTTAPAATNKKTDKKED